MTQPTREAFGEPIPENLTNPVDVFNAILKERKFQDEKYGKISENGGHTIGGWLLILEAELAEAKKAAIVPGMHRDNIIAEIIQVAAVAFACLEQHGINPIYRRTV